MLMTTIAKCLIFYEFRNIYVRPYFCLIASISKIMRISVLIFPATFFFTFPTPASKKTAKVTCTQKSVQVFMSSNR